MKATWSNREKKRLAATKVIFVNHYNKLAILAVPFIAQDMCDSVEPNGMVYDD